MFFWLFTRCHVELPSVFAAEGLMEAAYFCQELICPLRVSSAVCLFKAS